MFLILAKNLPLQKLKNNFKVEGKFLYFPTRSLKLVVLEIFTGLFLSPNHCPPQVHMQGIRRMVFSLCNF